MILTPEQKEFLVKSVVGKWSINPETGLIDVDGSVIVSDNYTKYGEIPVAFGKVTGDFDCSWNNLNTLKGCPYWVGGYFVSNMNAIETLEHAPKYVGGELDIYRCPLKSINWKPDFIGGGIGINFLFIPKIHHGNLIQEIDNLIELGVTLINPDLYYPYRDAYYESKIIDLL